MKYKILYVVAMFVLLAGAKSASAQHCLDGKTDQIVRLSELPEELKRLLGADLPGVAGIAEIDSKFNATDVIVEQLPMRRFQSAILNSQCAVVRLEHGGRAYGLQTKYFEYRDGHWQPTRFPEGKPVK